MQFQEKLRILRKQQGLTQRQLGEQIGVSHNFIHELEHGKSRPNIEHAIRISNLFGIPIDVLVRDELDLDVEDKPS